MSSAPPRWAAPLAAAVACSAFALWNPPLRDLAAHTFRAEYFEDHGFAIWNNSWYGGHYLLSYSVLFPPLAALLSPVWAGRRRRGHERMAVRSHRARALGRAGGVGGPVVRVARRRRAARERVAGVRARRRLRPRRAAGVAGGPARRRRRAGGRQRRWRARWQPRSWRWCARSARSTRRGAPALLGTVAAALVPLAVLGLLFPEGGQFPFWFSAWWPLALFCMLALLATRGIERDRDVRAATVAYLALATLAALAAQPAGRQHDAARLAVRRPGAAGDRAARAAPAALDARWPWRRWSWGSRGRSITPVRQTSESLGDPATERSYYSRS